MSSGRFSRRDLLQLGGRIAMTVGAAKIVVALPGCGGDDGGDDGGGADAPAGTGYDADAGYDYGYATLDDCHGFGTYDYVYAYGGYTYHYYFTSAYGCPGYLYPPVAGLDCYPDDQGYIPGYDYVCYSATYDTYTGP